MPLREGRLLAASELDRVLLAEAATCRPLWKQLCWLGCESFAGLGEWLATQPSGLLDPLSWKRALPLRQAWAGRPKEQADSGGPLRSPKEAAGTVDTSWPQLPAWCGLSPAPVPSCRTQVPQMGSCRGAQEDKTGVGG